MDHDYVEEVIKLSRFKPDDINKVKQFINSYIDKLNFIYGLDCKEKIIYLSGPVTNIIDYKENFEEMENIAYKFYSNQRIYVLNPTKVLDLITDYNFSYIDKIIICYCLLSICNVVIYDDRDDKYKSSIGTFSEVSYAMGKGIEVKNYTYVLSLIDQQKFIVNNYATNNVEKYMGLSVESDDDINEENSIQSENMDNINTEKEISYIELDPYGKVTQIQYVGDDKDETEGTNIDA